MIAWTELTGDEQLAIACALRLIIRADDRFDAQERALLDEIGARHVGSEALWRAISDSAVTFKTVDAMRGAVIAVRRAEARQLLIAVCEILARAHGGAPQFFEGVRAAWSRGDAGLGPFRG